MDHDAADPTSETLYRGPIWHLASYTCRIIFGYSDSEVINSRYKAITPRDQRWPFHLITKPWRLPVDIIALFIDGLRSVVLV